MNGTATVPTWEEVLAEVEADVERTERLLSDASAPAPLSGQLAPAELMLPAGPVVTLPDPASMPPVPTALAERIRALQQRIDLLSGELVTALAEMRSALVSTAVQEPLVRPAQAVPVPRFVDRAL